MSLRNRALALCLGVVMALGMLPLGAMAADSPPLVTEVDTSEASYNEGTYSGDLSITVQNSSNAQLQAALFLAFYTGGGKLLEVKSLPEKVFQANSRQSVELNALSVNNLTADSYYKVFALDARDEYKPLSESVEIPVDAADELVVYIDYEQSTAPWLDGETYQMMELDEYMKLIGAYYSVDPSTYAITFRRNNQYAAMAPGETQLLVQQSAEDSYDTYTLDNPPVIFEGRIYVPFDELSEALGMRVARSSTNGRSVVNIFTSDLIKGSGKATVTLNFAAEKNEPVTGCCSNGIAYYSLGAPTLYMFNGSAQKNMPLTGIPETMCVDKDRLYYIAKGVIYCTDLDSGETAPVYSADTDIYMLNIYNGELFFKVAENEASAETGRGTLCRYNPVLGTERQLGVIYGYDISDGILYAASAASEDSVSIQTTDLFTGETSAYTFPVSLAQEMYSFRWARPCALKISGNSLYVRLYFCYMASSSLTRFSNEYMVCDLNTGASRMVDYDTYDAVRSDGYLNSTSKSSRAIDFRTRTVVNNNLGDTSKIYTNLLMVDRETGESSVLIQGSASRGQAGGGYWNYLIYSYSYICGDDDMDVFLRVSENYTVPSYTGRTSISACTVNPENGNLVTLDSRTF